MGCNPGPHNDPAAARLRNDRVRRGEFDAVVEELATRIAYERGPNAVEATSSFRRMARLAGLEVFLRQNTALFGRLDRRPDLAGVTCPTLVIWGREDRFALVQNGAEMSYLMLGPRFVVLAAGGHLPPLERARVATAPAPARLGRIGMN